MSSQLDPLIIITCRLGQSSPSRLVGPSCGNCHSTFSGLRCNPNHPPGNPRGDQKGALHQWSLPQVWGFVKRESLCLTVLRLLHSLDIVELQHIQRLRLLCYQGEGKLGPNDGHRYLQHAFTALLLWQTASTLPKLASSWRMPIVFCRHTLSLRGTAGGPTIKHSGSRWQAGH